MNSDWWGWKPDPNADMYTSKGSGPIPSWAQTPTSSSSAQSSSITANQWAFVTNQNQSIQSLLLSENETGSNNRPPKLMHINEYPGWQERFHTYILGQNTELWLSFTKEFDQALEEAGSNAAAFADLSFDDKKTYDLEKKAFSILTQALNKDIYHQFVGFKTTISLWDALKARGQGNASSRKLRHDLLKKEFDDFMCMERESLGDMTSRFYHLLSEMGNFKVAVTPEEIVTKFADAFPAQWSGFLEILKYNGTLATTNIHDFIQLLENKNQEEIRKAKRVPVPQNPEMYYGNCGGTSTVSRPAQHAQLQTAFVLSTDMYGTPQPAATKQSYQSTRVPSFLDPNYKGQQQACYGNTSSTDNAGQPSNLNTVGLDTSSFSKVSVELAKEHMELLNTLVSAYCGLVAGQIGNINLTQEDYQQIDKDEMDFMDIKWAFASAVRRAKDFMERTGRTSLESKNDTKYGFNKQAVKCFNCGERGHFKRECTKPAQHGNHNPFRNQGNQQNLNQTGNNECALMPANNSHQAGPSNNNRAIVVQVNEGCDWSIQLGSGDQGGTACYAEVVKDLKQACGGESSDEDSSGYSGSSDEETSSSGEDSMDEVSHETINTDVEKPLSEAKAGNDRRSILVDQAAYSSSSQHSAFMANVGVSSSQLLNCLTCKANMVICKASMT
ncbi:putative transcription factor interactor and regulator CCHC(Zn) family [Helianthus annuus]|nr:putative transcription factor interactor and regulator CCHC(Zn) family [Helianthus annuus]